MRKKLFYLSYINEDIRPGYKQKIYGQIKAFSEFDKIEEVYLGIIGNSCYRIYKVINRNIFLEKEVKVKRYFGNEKNYFDDLFLFYKYIKEVKKFFIEKEINIFYIRRIFPITPILLRFLKELKNHKVKIFYEYPTFPWEEELKKGNSKVIYYSEKLQYRKLIEKVDIFCLMGNNLPQKIKNKKVLKLQNGIDLEFIEKIKSKEIKKNEIQFIGVAALAFWHGYDRLILGIKNYYEKNENTRIVKFDIIGNGDSKIVQNLKELVKKYELERYIKFYGYKEGEELNKCYNKANIGVGSLANFRKKLNSGGGLKNREYCAKGIPFIISGEDSSFKGCSFVKNVFFSEGAININEILEWYDNLTVSSKEIRYYADKNLNWKKELEKVVEHI